MLLPNPLDKYDRTNEAQVRRSIETEDRRNVKKGGPYDLQSPNGTWWRPTISNLGTVTWTAL